jgi:hypothetical protein
LFAGTFVHRQYFFRHDAPAVLRYELEPDGDGTLLTMTFTRLTPTTACLFANGLTRGLDRLERHLEAA